MDIAEQIREGLRDLASRFGPAPTLLGTIASVDADEKTCIITDEEVDIPEVRLRPVIDDTDGLTMYPKVGAWAIAIRVEQDNEWMLIAAGEYDKWRLVIGTTIMEQTADGLLIQKGADTLKQILSLIIDAVQQIVVVYGNNPDYTKLQQALTKANNLLR